MPDVSVFFFPFFFLRITFVSCWNLSLSPSLLHTTGAPSYCFLHDEIPSEACLVIDSCLALSLINHFRVTGQEDSQAGYRAAYHVCSPFFFPFLPVQSKILRNILSMAILENLFARRVALPRLLYKKNRRLMGGSKIQNKANN